MIKQVLILKKTDYEKMLKAVDDYKPRKPFGAREYLYLDDDDMRDLIKNHLKKGIENTKQPSNEKYVALLWKEYEEKPYFIPEDSYVWEYIHDSKCAYDYAEVDYDKKKTNRQSNWNSYAIKFELDIKIL